jgi:NAD(P)-dependent dehydrogenase (short-subunit alcohol dehydrogenase family)
MTDRIVIVTGATGELGSATAAGFRKAGSEVVAVARSSPDWAFDLSEPTAADRLVRAVLARYGGLDVVVHTIGGYAAGGITGEKAAETWSRMIDINLRTTAATLAAAVPVLQKQGRGRFIAVGSRAGTGPTPGAAAYAATKAAVHSLVQTAAAELKGSGVTVNAVLPSTLDTAANRNWGTPEQVATWVKPESVTEAILWLASDLAADVTGCLLPVYGAAE